MILVLLFTTLIVYFLVNFFLNVREYPPGPLALPLIGNIPAFVLGTKKYGRILYLFLEWKKKYGNMFTVWLGPLPTIWITDYELGLEAMVKKGAAFVDRQNFFLFDILRYGRGLVNANGSHWEEQRRFTLHTLRDFGLGKNVMEERIGLELDDRMGQLDKLIEENGGEVQWNPHKFIDLTVGNIINRILFSDRFTEEKEVEFFRLKQALDKTMKDLSPLDILTKEWNKNWPLFNARYERMLNCTKPVFDFVKEQVEEKKEQLLHRESVAEDFVEAYLQHMKKENIGESFDEETLIVTLVDLWVAGQETTATTLNWAFVYLTLYSEKTKKLQKELDSVTGRSRSIQLSDRPSTPYLNAVVLEVLRVSSIIPMNLWRVAVEDVQVGGYLIKKGTVVSVQPSIIMGDEANYKTPREFNPDRFLEGESEQKVLTFSLGKRSCLGESLARAELYMIIGNMALAYNFQGISNNLPKMEAEQEDGSLRTPFPYKILLSKRQ